MTLKVLDLFSGIGGFSLGLERAGMKTVAFCEADKHAILILKKHWPGIPIHEDVRTLDGKQYSGTIDVVCGGFPCQDLSATGKMAGFAGNRSSLYREMLRIISECLPRYAIFENVTGLLTGENGRWFAQFLFDLESVGYDAEWHCIPASEVGAHHHRDRVWIIAYPESINDQQREREPFKRQKHEFGKGTGRIKVFADAEGKRRERFGKVAHNIKKQMELMRSVEAEQGRFDLSAPPLCGANDGVSRRLDRIRRLGNAVVPQIPEIIGRAILAL